jgi:cytochrome c556
MRAVTRLLALAVVAGLIVLAGGAAWAQKKARGPMQRKLEHAQKVVEGLATNDFRALAQHAEELIAISKEAEWKVLKTARYQLYSSDFRQQAQDLVDHAKEKNIDGAALAYVEMTLTCVKCHKHVREVRMTRLD